MQRAGAEGRFRVAASPPRIPSSNRLTDVKTARRTASNDPAMALNPYLSPRRECLTPVLVGDIADFYSPMDIYHSQATSVLSRLRPNKVSSCTL